MGNCADTFFHQYAQDSDWQGTAPDGSKSRTGKRSQNLSQYCTLGQSFWGDNRADGPSSARSAEKLGQLLSSFEGIAMDNKDPNRAALEDDLNVMPTIA